MQLESAVVSIFGSVYSQGLQTIGLSYSGQQCAFAGVTSQSTIPVNQSSRLISSKKNP